MGYERLGLAHCRDRRRQADLAARHFREDGLEVELPAEAAACDPVGQALEFERAGTDLNVIVGMCVGHDTLFMRRSSAPVTSLVVRDLRLRDNPVAALYPRGSYLKSALYRPGASSRRGRRLKLDDATIGMLAAEVRDAGVSREDPPCRLEEVMEFSWRAGVRRLGIAYCVGFREEAAALRAVLRTNGFEVSSVWARRVRSRRSNWVWRTRRR